MLDCRKYTTSFSSLQQFIKTFRLPRLAVTMKIPLGLSLIKHTTITSKFINQVNHHKVDQSPSTDLGTHSATSGRHLRVVNKYWILQDIQINKTEYDGKCIFYWAQMNINHLYYPNINTKYQFHRLPLVQTQLLGLFINMQYKTTHPLLTSLRLGTQLFVLKQNTDREVTKYSVVICKLDESLLSSTAHVVNKW